MLLRSRARSQKKSAKAPSEKEKSANSHFSLPPQWNPDSEPKAARQGENKGLEQDRQKRTGKVGWAKWDRQSEIGRIEHAEQDWQNRTGITGQAQDRTGRIGLPRQDLTARKVQDS